MEKFDEENGIRNVWIDNFEEELEIISKLISQYAYIAMVNDINLTQNWLIGY